MTRWVVVCIIVDMSDRLTVGEGVVPLTVGPKPETRHCKTCGAMPDSSGLHHSVSCPERTKLEPESGEMTVTVRDFGPGQVMYIPPSPPDLLPLILLELRLLREAVVCGLPYKAMTDMAGRGKRTTEDWRTQMKDLGHWDERYED